jgi:hypothetical protein
MDVEMELSRVLITEYGPGQLIYLRERGGQERTFPIVIGTMEALAIDRRLNNKPTPRPMTHDLLAGVIAAMGGKLERILIHDLRLSEQPEESSVFIATIYIRQGGKLVEVDSRPSDAIALGVGLGTPIFVSEKVLGEATATPQTPEQRLEYLRVHKEALGRRIEAVQERLEDQEFLNNSSRELIEEHHRLLEQMQHEYDAIEQVLKKFS